jgi:methylase of polypeptide subunit release factors
VDGDVRATLRLVPHKDVLVAYEPGAEPPEGSHLLANMTVRMHFVSALQAEAGTGMHALLAARHTDRAVAVEADARALALIRVGALLNALDNLEAVEGENLDPLAGHSYGLIVAKPPRVLSPEEDERADTRCRELAKAVASHLSEGGFAHVLVTWVLGTAEDWWSPLEQWVAGTGCDAILLLEREDDPAGYASAHADPGSVARWTGFLRDLAADRIASGAIVLRRRSRGRNWVRREVIPETMTGPAGDQIVRTFVNHDLLASLPADDQLLDEVLAVVEPQRIEQVWRHKDEGLELESARARLEWGLGFSVGVDAYTIELLARVDGRRRLRDLFAEIARDSQLEEDSVARAGLPAVRRLLELGFLARA